METVVLTPGNSRTVGILSTQPSVTGLSSLKRITYGACKFLPYRRTEWVGASIPQRLCELTYSQPFFLGILSPEGYRGGRSST